MGTGFSETWWQNPLILDSLHKTNKQLDKILDVYSIPFISTGWLLYHGCASHKLLYIASYRQNVVRMLFDVRFQSSLDQFSPMNCSIWLVAE